VATAIQNSGHCDPRTVATAIPKKNLIKITAPASEEVFSNIRQKTLVKNSQSVKHFTSFHLASSFRNKLYHELTHQKLTARNLIN
jgi:hypothetical protein